MQLFQNIEGIFRLIKSILFICSNITRHTSEFPSNNLSCGHRIGGTKISTANVILASMIRTDCSQNKIWGKYANNQASRVNDARNKPHRCIGMNLTRMSNVKWNKIENCSCSSRSQSKQGPVPHFWSCPVHIRLVRCVVIDRQNRTIKNEINLINSVRLIASHMHEFAQLTDQSFEEKYLR